MIRFVWCFLFVVIMAGTTVRAEHVIVSGGPSLRQWEDLRIKKDRHDRWWANFIRAATVRMDQIRKDPGSDPRIVWMVFRPGFAARGSEDGKPYITWISEVATKRGATLIWFSSREEFIRALNGRPQQSIRSFDYFGHSNRYTFMFEYGSEIIASSTAWLHQDDLRMIKPSIFRKDAICTSWGCHTGQSMSLEWKKALNIPLRGVKGPTNYVTVGQGLLPMANGKWTE